jgi:hypothetical protein
MNREKNEYSISRICGHDNENSGHIKVGNFLASWTNTDMYLAGLSPVFLLWNYVFPTEFV